MEGSIKGGVLAFGGISYLIVGTGVFCEVKGFGLRYVLSFGSISMFIKGFYWIGCAVLSD